MPRNTIGASPFPLRLLDKDGAVTVEDILTALGNRAAVSICLRRASGPEKRGGYFFHIRKSATHGELQLYDFEQNLVAVRSQSQMARFMTHCSGRGFDEESLALCQETINLRKDAE